MRELKFRAWDKLDKEFAHNIDCLLDISVAERVFALDDEGGELIIEQYTGLKDKNGKEIYEGDIVNIQGIKYYVDFEYGGFWFNNDNRIWKANRPLTHFQEINDTEVVGNIHESPELLEDGE